MLTNKTLTRVVAGQAAVLIFCLGYISGGGTDGTAVTPALAAVKTPASSKPVVIASLQQHGTSTSEVQPAQYPAITGALPKTGVSLATAGNIYPPTGRNSGPNRWRRNSLIRQTAPPVTVETPSIWSSRTPGAIPRNTPLSTSQANNGLYYPPEDGVKAYNLDESRSGSVSRRSMIRSGYRESGAQNRRQNICCNTVQYDQAYGGVSRLGPGIYPGFNPLFGSIGPGMINPYGALYPVR